MKFDVVIVGGGAAGLFCAIESSKRGRRTLVIERNSQVGRKIIISGGGRCNFTNINASPENFISRNPHFCKSALARYTPGHFIDLVKKHRIEFYEKKLGQLFCRESSRQIVEMLLKECAARRVVIRESCEVNRIEHDATFRLTTSSGDIECESLVVATGGLSFAKVGATDFGYKIAGQFGLKIEPTRPSLVPLIFDRALQAPEKLAGISIDSAVTTNGQTFRENILFTHRGLSGPAILQVSNYWKRNDPVFIDLMPSEDASKMLADNSQGRQKTSTLLSKYLPDRFASAFVTTLLPADRAMNQIPLSELDQLGQNINAWEVRFSGTEGFDRAEVTLGGVSTEELSSQTMEARKVPGLFFIGEVVDVTGWLGGYNFQWAWSSGYAAGQAV